MGADQGEEFCLYRKERNWGNSRTSSRLRNCGFSDRWGGEGSGEHVLELFVSTTAET